jgi:multidrug efflux system membrane fusion protein
VTQGSRRWIGLLAGLALAACVWGFSARLAPQASRGSASRASATAAERPVPVVIAPAVHRDVPIYLEGLGTVIAYYTVTVRTRVDGQLMRVYFREGQRVREGELLAQIDPRPFVIQLHQAQASLGRDRAQLHANRLALERDRQLRAQNFIAPQDFDNQHALVAQLEAAVRADQALIENARLQLEYARITSPIAGVTGVRQVDPGNIVHASDANGLVVVTQIDPITVLFTLPQDDFPRVAVELAQRSLPVEVFSRDNTIRLGAGTLALIDNQIVQTTATIRLKAVLPNPTGLLWPQQFVKVRLLVTTEHDALVIPPAAVQRGPQGTYVYVVGPDERAVYRPVEIGRIDAETAIVTHGVSVGESVVTEGQSHLRPGLRVAPRAAEPAPARGGGARP